MAFLRNVWYAAAWSDEVKDEIFYRRILGEPIAFYRLGDGTLNALASRCPHRFAALHLGKRVGDGIKCPYHGLEFGADGRCVHNPHGQGAPPPLAVHRYPVVERNSFIWIWMGDSAGMDPAKAGIEYSYLNDPKHFAVARGTIHLDCDYRLAVDNLLDHAHITELHDSSLYSEALTAAKTMIRREDDAIFVERWGPNGKPPPLFGSMLGNLEDPVDHWANMRWQAPSLLSLDSGATPTGRPRDEGITFRVAHIVTPETEATTHYFWATARDFKVEDDSLTDQLQKMIGAIFIEEDKWMLEQQQEMMNGAEFWSLRPALLPCDVGTAMVRRELEKLIKGEAERSAAKSREHMAQASSEMTA